jgi:predicted kinase
MLDFADAPEIVFVMGLPAAGKSTWITKYLPTYGWIDPDRIKGLHPKYNPREPHLVHQWSKTIAIQMFNNVLKRRRGSWVIEGTGANAEEMVFNIKTAHNAGYATSLVYIKCTLTKVIVRNTYRARNIPVDIILELHGCIPLRSQRHGG